MEIIEASEKDLNNIKNFLIPYEKYCVSMVNRIIKNEVAIYILKDVEKIAGVFSISNGGQILHCIPLFFNGHLKNEKKAELQKIFSEFFRQNCNMDFFSIIGEENTNNFMINTVYEGAEKIPLISNHYILMEKNRQSECAKNQCEISLNINKCQLTDLDALMPIQKMYEEEEVLEKLQQYSPASSRFFLKKSLNENNVYAATQKSTGKIIGKISLNAKGINYSQIGGVYTLPDFRKKGVARSLINFITAAESEYNKNCVLFVRRQNFNAQKLYEKCGFTRICDFKICYYEV